MSVAFLFPLLYAAGVGGSGGDSPGPRARHRPGQAAPASNQVWLCHILIGIIDCENYFL
jgi:hypothetical protein